MGRFKCNKLLCRSLDVPTSGWRCILTEHHEKDEGFHCELCGNLITEVFHVVHPHYRRMIVGGDHAKELIGLEAYHQGKHDIREKRFQLKKKLTQRQHAFQENWNRSSYGNFYQYFEGNAFIVHKYLNVWKAKNGQVGHLFNTPEDGKRFLMFHYFQIEE